MSLGTLAGQTLVSALFDNVVNERTFVSSVVAKYDITNWTKGTDKGPILVGLAHSDYTDAEIEEWVEDADSWNEGNLVRQEIAKRKIRQVGVFETPDDANETLVLNDGKAIRTKCGWILLQGQTLRLWVFNLGA